MLSNCRKFDPFSCHVNGWARIALPFVVLYILLLGASSEPVSSLETPKDPSIRGKTDQHLSDIKYLQGSIDMDRKTLSIQQPSSFTFSQVVEDVVDSNTTPEHAMLNTIGEVQVRVRDASPGQRAISVETEIRAPHHSLATFRAIQVGNSITIATPRKTAASFARADGEATVFLASTIWISRGLELSSFKIHADSLDVVVRDGALMPSYIPTSISAPSSSVRISAPRLPSSLAIDSRRTTINAQSGSVNGDFTLSDTLTIHTQSGSININLSLEDSTNTTTPATLDLRARSGSIKVNTPTILTPSKIPNRDFHSTLRTNSGSITAILIHGSSTILHSDSSSIHATLHPHGDTVQRSDLTTHVLSGSSDITVLPSLTNSLAPLRNFHASHRGVSGSIRVLYPAQWEGTVEGSTVSGSIRVNWPGLKILEDKSGWGSHRLKGVKGSGGGVLGFTGVSGSVELKGMPAVMPVEEEEVLRGGAQRAVGEEVEKVMEGGPQRVLTPGSEAGDEWVFVQ